MLNLAGCSQAAAVLNWLVLQLEQTVAPGVNEQLSKTHLPVWNLKLNCNWNCK